MSIPQKEVRIAYAKASSHTQELPVTPQFATHVGH